MEIKLNSGFKSREILKVKRIRYKCSECSKTHTFKLKGIERNKSISNFIVNSIHNEFYETQSFTTISKRYNISVQTVINIFDNYTKIMPRRTLPQYLCIDEKYFEGDTDEKYCVVLSDSFSGEIIDVLENRQMPYLDEYFKNISSKERDNVKVFISDIYDGYSILQEMLHYDKYETYSEAEKFVNRIISKLYASNDELLHKVADSYKKWKVGIINGLARNQTDRRYSNAIAESNNSHIQRVINVAYGYRNFKRFRVRIMLILSYKKRK